MMRYENDFICYFEKKLRRRVLYTAKENLQKFDFLEFVFVMKETVQVDIRK